MQGEIAEKTIALFVKAGSMGGEALRLTLIQMSAELRGIGMGRTNEKPRIKRHGKIQYSKLAAMGDGLTKIDLSSPNLRLLDKEMKKSGVSFSVDKTGNGGYVLFFRSRDTDAISLAFDRYAKRALENAKKPPLRKALSKHRAKAAKLAKVKIKTKVRSR
jgi:hypothetical protein